MTSEDSVIARDLSTYYGVISDLKTHLSFYTHKNTSSCKVKVRRNLSMKVNLGRLNSVVIKNLNLKK